ncbi:hypothetical protein RDWZM_004400 [Blomia tropicalis]|uniref:MCM C-terminal AAA(+) ATPase domain-containing protein n=1 Tax=Blomia tropicalis TaxID=40697 RepID=A0A9Q0MH25_BLOTA|nr:hypothetical protein RDWZM_004400 [Blomia tropicalis]
MSKVQQQVIIQSIEHKKIGIRNEYELLFYSSNVSFIAVANLNSNEYDSSKSIQQNVKINNELISKFDLIFNIEDEDSNQNIELIYQEEVKRIHHNNSSFSNESNQSEKTNFIFCEDNLISSQFVYQYISYCFQNVHPIMCENIKEMLKHFCLQETSQITPSKLRLFESISRLIEAHAKLFMREEVIKQDLLAAIDIFQASLTMSKEQTVNMGLNGKEAKKPKFGPKILYKLLCEMSIHCKKKKFKMEEIIESCLIHLDNNLPTATIQQMVYCLNDQALLLKSGDCFEIL